MYSWIWSKLPGRKLTKAVFVLAILVGLVLFMFTIGFPVIEHLFKVDQTTIKE